MANQRLKAFKMASTVAYKEYYRMFHTSIGLVHKEWFIEGGFLNFLNDMGHPPKDGKYYIGKIDENGFIEPSNCCWVKKKTCIVDFEISKEDKDKLNSAGIYILTFDNGCFYIGSTKNFKRRVSCFIGSFNGVSKMHNKRMSECLLDCKYVSFKIIKVIADANIRVALEGVEIGKYIGNPLMLNRALDPTSNKGIRWTKEETDKTRNALKEKYKQEGVHKFWLHRKKANPLNQYKKIY